MAINRAYRKPGFEAYDETELRQVQAAGTTTAENKNSRSARCSSGSLGVRCIGEGNGTTCFAKIGVLCTGTGSVGTSCRTESSGVACVSGKSSVSCESNAQSTDQAEKEQIQSAVTEKKP